MNTREEIDKFLKEKGYKIKYHLNRRTIVQAQDKTCAIQYDEHHEYLNFAYVANNRVEHIYDLSFIEALVFWELL